MKFSMKRLAALAMALVMVLGMLPVMNNMVSAVDVSGTLSDSSIGLTASSANKPNAASGWTASGNTITGTVTGEQIGTSNRYQRAAITLEITNNKATPAVLSFSYAMSGDFGTIKVGTTTYTAAGQGSFEEELAAGGSVTISLTHTAVSQTGPKTLNIEISDISLVPVGGGAIKTTFQAPAYGSYTIAYADQLVTMTPGTADVVAENTADVQYTLTCTPGQGNKFVGWYNVKAGNYLSTSTTCSAKFGEESVIKAIVVPETAAVFLVGSNYFADLDEAVTYAQNKGLNQITLVSSGTVSKSEKGIPAGITLLIPMDSAYTLTGKDQYGFIAPEYTLKVEQPYAYMTMTLADGVTLKVDGTIDIEAKHTTMQGSGAERPYGNSPSGAYGAILMNPNSNITLNDGGILYAWGYVYGEGTITAKSGSSVYEYMQVLDFPGGSNMAGFADSTPEDDEDGDGNPNNDQILKIFPFQQYYVQNIEVELTLETGATEYVFATVTALKTTSNGVLTSHKTYSAPPIEFIGENGMFVPVSGSIVKYYDPSTDRMTVDVNGDAKMNGIALDMSDHPFGEAMELVAGSTTFDSGDYILVINGNITININNGTTTIGQDMILMPGVEISVAEDAVLIIAEMDLEDRIYNNLTVEGSGGHNIYVFDAENWGNFVFSNKPLLTASYSPSTGRIKRTADSLKDVVIDINGTVLCDGFVYTTVTCGGDEWLPISGGAAIISSGKTGQIVMNNGAGTEIMAYHLDGTGAGQGVVDIASAWLRNGDGTYLQTAGAAAGTTFVYNATKDCWMQIGVSHLITWIGPDGILASTDCEEGKAPQYPGENPTKPANGCTVYTFAGWSLTDGGEVLSELPAVTGEAAYYAVFTESISHVGDNDKDHFCDYAGCGDKLSECVDENKDHICDYTGCGDKLSECVDENKDHFCDYTGCGDELSECVDENKDHFCDYTGCGDELSECVDENKDHICDYAGCQAVVSECRDVNQDHFCDYLGCLKELDGCVDNDKDHYCDYDGCDEKLSDCEDGNDNNHNCDYIGCNKENVDNGHHGGTAYCNMLALCDECGERYGSLDPDNHSEDGHYDVVSDNQHQHYYPCCGTYGAITSCSDRDNDGDHQCDYCVNNGITDCVSDATYACEDGNCVECGQEMPATVSHETNYACDTHCKICGEEIWPDAAHEYEYECDTQCQYCGEEIWPDAECVSDADYLCEDGNCIWCGEPVAATENHDWADATCTAPKTCNGCGAEDGNALGHGTIEGWDFIDYGEYHEVWCKDCWDYSYTDDHDYGDDHECDCGAVETYTVTFMNGDKVFAEDTYDHGSPLNIYGMPIPDAPAAGYGFNGWYDAQNNELVLGMAVTSDLTFYASWKLNSYTITWIVDGKTTTESYTYGEVPTFKGSTDKAADGCTTYTFDGWDKTIVAVTGSVTYTAQYITGTSHIGKVNYTNLNNGYHKTSCDACGEVLNEAAEHVYDQGWAKATCSCGAAKEFKLTVVYGANGEYKFELMVPYWTPMADLDEFNNIPWTIYVNDATHLGHYALDDFYWDMDGDGDLDWDRYFIEGYMPARDLYVEARYDFEGWANDGIGWQFIDRYNGIEKNTIVTPTMDTFYEDGSESEIEGVYMMDANGYRIENGLGRFYYLGECPLNGVTYAPNAEDIAYYENKGLTFIDKEMTWYYFGEDGKWQYNYTGVVGNSYVVNGQAVWHVGLVKVGDDYYYFNGDTVNGGNKAHTGDIYIIRNTTGESFVQGGVYTFGADGKLCNYDGIVDMTDGSKRYYKNAQLMMGNGLTQVGENYIYVNTYGELVVNAEYFIGTNDFDIAKGIYYFDENGFLVMPEADPVKNGFYFEDGSWYYYVDGMKGYCAGLISTTGMLWYDSADAEGEEIQGWVYVKSNGALVSGQAYYVTNVNDHSTIKSGDKCFFGDDCLLQTAKDGVIDGYYYVNNNIAYNAGVVEIEDGKYIYVRSNGQVVAGRTYWITNVGDSGVIAGLYMFDEDGVMINPETEVKEGIVDGYYYVNGHIAYCAGVIEIEEGKYIYVRSNGQLATGEYWTTNHNGELPEGLYDFGEDGILVIE